MDIIKLNHEWKLISKLNSGGFGTIYAAKSEEGKDVVVKLIPKKRGTARELLFENIGNLPNVLPIIETGEWNDNWVIVMPRADKSLKDYLEESEGKLEQNEATLVLVDILTALAALQGNIIHRDLKPANVLYWKGHWYLADFGIARYVLATTSSETWKHAKTWAYASPEQWRGERTTSATDIYATGIIAYELIMGKRPFGGPEEHDYRDQHLHQEAIPPTGCSPLLSALIAECLFKAPNARPTAGNILMRLQDMQKPESEASNRLLVVNQAAVIERAKQEALISSVKTANEIRDQLAIDANKSLGFILGTLKERLVKYVSQGSLTESSANSWQFSLNQIRLGCLGFKTVETAVLNSPGFPAPFEAIGFSTIFIEIPFDQYGYEGRSHALWFCDAVNKGSFRWYETAFMYGVFSGKDSRKDPFALEPCGKAGRALSPIMGTEYQIAWPFTPIDQGEQEKFIERWIGWFADAVEDKLRHPHHMPEQNPAGSWRKK